MGVDLARIFEADWCRRVPADALVLGARCGAERVLDRKRHRCRLEPEHRGEHVCWCDRTLDERAGPPASRGVHAVVASIGLRLAWIALIVIAFGCAGPRGFINGDLVFELKEDGRYTGTWTNGSSCMGRR